MPTSLDRDLLNSCIKRLRPINEKIIERFEHDYGLRNDEDLEAGHKLSLKEISMILQVPVILASYRNQYGIMHHTSYGLGLDVPISKLSNVSNAVCKNGMVIYPDISMRSEFLFCKDCEMIQQNQFYAGLAIKNNDGIVLGSLAVLQERKVVAYRGISLALMTKFGKQVIDQANGNKISIQKSDDDNIKQGERLTPKRIHARLAA